jgi:hypothetical protein
MDSSSSRTKCISVSTAGRSGDERRSLRLGEIRREVNRAADERASAREFAPTARAVTAANVPDILQLEPLVAALPAVAGGPGRPRRKPGAKAIATTGLAPAARN